MASLALKFNFVNGFGEGEPEGHVLIWPGSRGLCFTQVIGTKIELDSPSACPTSGSKAGALWAEVKKAAKIPSGVVCNISAQIWTCVCVLPHMFRLTCPTFVHPGSDMKLFHGSDIIKQHDNRGLEEAGVSPDGVLNYIRVPISYVGVTTRSGKARSHLPSVCILIFFFRKR